MKNVRHSENIFSDKLLSLSLKLTNNELFASNILEEDNLSNAYEFALGTIASEFVQYHCVNEVKNFEQKWNFLSDMHKNLISTRLY